MQRMQLQSSKFFWVKLTRIGQIWLDLGKIGVNLGIFERNLGKSD